MSFKNLFEELSDQDRGPGLDSFAGSDMPVGSTFTRVLEGELEKRLLKALKDQVLADVLSAYLEESNRQNEGLRKQLYDLGSRLKNLRDNDRSTDQREARFHRELMFYVQNGWPLSPEDLSIAYARNKSSNYRGPLFDPPPPSPKPAEQPVEEQVPPQSTEASSEAKSPAKKVNPRKKTTIKKKDVPKKKR